MQILLLIIEVLIALWIYFDCKKQGFSNNTALIFFFGSIFLPIVFIPIYLIRKNFAVLNNSSAIKTKFCPKCGEEINYGLSICPKCKNNQSI